MKLFFRSTLVLLFTFLSISVSATEQVRRAPASNLEGQVTKIVPATGGGVAIPGDSRLYTPLSPAEEEKLGREGVKRKMMEQRR